MDFSHTTQVGRVNVESGGLDLLERHAEEWRSLLEKSSESDIYSRPEWILAHLRAYSPNARVVVLTLREGNSLSAILPFVLEREISFGFPTRKLRVPLSMPGANCELVIAPGVDQTAVLRSVWEALRSCGDWDVLELPSVFENTPAERLSQFAQSESYRTERWALPPISWLTISEQDMEKLPPSSAMRKHLRQAERKLSALGQLNLRKFDDACPVTLQRFYELEAGGWKGQEQSAILRDPRRQKFFSEVAKESEKLRHLSVYFLELDGKLISAHFGLYYRGRYYTPKIAYDEKYEPYSVGHLILSKIMRECVAQGISEYSMGVREEWKNRWTSETRARTYHRIFDKGTRGQLLFMAHQVKPSLKSLLRWLRGKGAGRSFSRSLRKGGHDAGEGAGCDSTEIS